MPTRSRWPDERMWAKAVELRLKGKTYSQICGQLQRLFELEEVPSEDTVRKQVKRRLIAGEAAGPTRMTEPTAPEQYHHRLRLFYFGQRLRDLLTVPGPMEVVRGAYHPWTGEGPGFDGDAPRDQEEKDVAAEWGHERVDATRLSLFELFKAHLAENACWQTLTALRDASREDSYPGYRRACRHACERLENAVRSEVPHILPEERKLMAEALLAGASYRLETQKPLYEPRVFRSGTDDINAAFTLELGSRIIQRRTQPEANALMEAFLRLLDEASDSDDVKALAASRAGSTALRDAFRAHLSPDDRLRKLVLAGRCELCI